jgi:large subunit ribosomal protein L29|tara:strand:+ start:40 stop:246 length:207 start_codon:yes stop_codon:yes gene_type:complete
MKAKTLKGLPKGELSKKLEDLRKDLIKNNSQIAAGTTPKSPGQVKQIKKTIARIKTIMHSTNIKGKPR